MAKQIYVTDEEVAQIMRDIEGQIRSSKCCGYLDIKHNFPKDKRSATVYFTCNAWVKMQALIAEFSTEVQWHGLVRRLSESEFEIYDIIVPPHTVTATTVTSDEVKYSEWINALDDDTFEALRCHGHSHVNMGCSPSSVDMKLRNDVVTQLPKDSFYLFFIFNKKGEWTGEIYDVANNALYETNEIDVEVYTDSEEFLGGFIADAKAKAISPPVSVVTPMGKETTKKEKSWRDYYDMEDFPYLGRGDY